MYNFLTGLNYGLILAEPLTLHKLNERLPFFTYTDENVSDCATRAQAICINRHGHTSHSHLIEPKWVRLEAQVP